LEQLRLRSAKASRADQSPTTPRPTQSRVSNPRLPSSCGIVTGTDDSIAAVNPGWARKSQSCTNLFCSTPSASVIPVGPPAVHVRQRWSETPRRPLEQMLNKCMSASCSGETYQGGRASWCWNRFGRYRGCRLLRTGEKRRCACSEEYGWRRVRSAVTRCYPEAEKWSGRVDSNERPLAPKTGTSRVTGRLLGGDAGARLRSVDTLLVCPFGGDTSSRLRFVEASAISPTMAARAGLCRRIEVCFTVRVLSQRQCPAADFALGALITPTPSTTFAQQ
jgi:hypothetical protein